MAEEKKNILVVDDTEAICSALRDMLTMAGYAVRTAPSGERALQIMESTNMDLVITDLRMSGMSGLDLLKKVKQRTPSVPVIILTGFGDMDSVIAAMRAGVADYLKKPFSVNEVLEVVRRELKRAEFVEVTAPQVQAQAAAVAVTETGERPPRLYIFSPPDLGGIEKALAELRAQITAESVLLLEEAGYVIAAKGTLSESELPTLTTLIVSSRMATAKLARMLGEEQTFALNYLEGQRVSVYTASLAQGLFLVLVVPKHVKQGAVWLYAKKAAGDIEKIAMRALEKATPPKPAAMPVIPTKEELRQELAQQAENIFQQPAAVPEAAPAERVQTLTFEEAMQRGLMGDLVKMMAQAPEAEATQPAPPPAPEPAPPEPVETMSFEEAMKRGLIGDLGQALGQPPAPPEPEPAQPVETLSFEEAMKRGLIGDLGQSPAAPPPEPEPEQPTEVLSFEEALKRGLLGNLGAE